jgi:hypothetical protein
MSDFIIGMMVGVLVFAALLALIGHTTERPVSDEEAAKLIKALDKWKENDND